MPLISVSNGDFPACSTLVAPVHTHFVCCCIQTGLTQNVTFMSPQQHSGYSWKLNVGCIERFYKIIYHMI